MEIEKLEEAMRSILQNHGYAFVRVEKFSNPALRGQYFVFGNLDDADGLEIHIDLQNRIYTSRIGKSSNSVGVENEDKFLSSLENVLPDIVENHRLRLSGKGNR